MEKKKSFFKIKNGLVKIGVTNGPFDAKRSKLSPKKKVPQENQNREKEKKRVFFQKKKRDDEKMSE